MDRRRLFVGSLAVATVVGLSGGWWLADRDGNGAVTLPAAGAGSVPDSGIPVATDVSGAQLPDVKARTLDGDAVSLRSLQGQPLILNFWSSTCVPCRKEMPAFEAAHRAVGNRVRIVGIDPQDSPELAISFARKVGATYELLRDPDGSVTAAFGVAALPTTIFVSRDGTVLKSKPGALSAAALRSTIDSLYPDVINGAFALAFISGVVATVNPCGFAMLPAYLSYFLGLENRAAGDDEPARASLTRALVVSASVSAGFLAVFTVLGFIVRAGGHQVTDVARYLGIVIGFALIGFGVALLCGFKLSFATPKLERGGRSRTLSSMFVFGVSYAIASFGCTIGPFLGVVLSSFTRDGTVSGVLMIVAYGLGMGLLLTALTVTLALARGGLLRTLRSAMRSIDTIAGGLMILAGLYLVYYWWYDLVSDTGAKPVAGGGISSWFQARADAVAGWLIDRGAGLLALVLGAVVVAAMAVVLTRRPKDVAGRPDA